MLLTKRIEKEVTVSALSLGHFRMRFYFLDSRIDEKSTGTEVYCRSTVQEIDM